YFIFFFQAEDGIRDRNVTGVQTCALPILKRGFGITDILNGDTSQSIWEKCNHILSDHQFSARSVIKQFNVKSLCTTDDPVDSLQHHKIIKSDKNFNVRVLPTFRPDNAINIQSPSFLEWLHELESVTSKEITSYNHYLEALH